MATKSLSSYKNGQLEGRVFSSEMDTASLSVVGRPG